MRKGELSTADSRGVRWPAGATILAFKLPFRPGRHGLRMAPAAGLAPPQAASLSARGGPRSEVCRRSTKALKDATVGRRMPRAGADTALGAKSGESGRVPMYNPLSCLRSPVGVDIVTVVLGSMRHCTLSTHSS